MIIFCNFVLAVRKGNFHGNTWTAMVSQGGLQDQFHDRSGKEMNSLLPTPLSID